MHSTSQLAQECLGLSEAVIDVGFGAGAEEFTPLECELDLRSGGTAIDGCGTGIL
jgi:hypothetical protein